MKIHPAASLFPMMTQEELDGLVKDVREWGLREPIELLDGAVIDGRNRIRACELAGVEPVFRELYHVDQSPTAYVISKNLHRRNLTISQRAAIAVEALPMFEQEARERMLRGVHLDDPSADLHQGKSTTMAANTVEISARTVAEAKAVKNEDPELFQKIKDGELTVHSAAKRIGRHSGSHRGNRRRKTDLREAMAPLLRYLKDWHEDRLYGTTPKQARSLLKQVQEIDRTLFEVERALEERSITSRALK